MDDMPIYGHADDVRHMPIYGHADVMSADVMSAEPDPYPYPYRLVLRGLYR